MKLYILKLGWLQVPASVLDGSAPEESTALAPISALLIRHEAGNLLFDLGSREGDEGYTHAPDETMVHQLALAGIRPEDVDLVVVSHLHGDHIGNIDLFPQARVYLTREEWAGAEKWLGNSFQPRERLRFLGVGEEVDLLEGVRVLTLPGHTANLLGLQVTLPEGTLLFPSDCMYGPYNMMPEHQPKHVYHAGNYRDSIEKVTRIARETGGKIIYAHWTEQYEALPKAPSTLEAR